MTPTTPVFYDCEASDVEGFPIEIGWAYVDAETATVVSEAHLIAPADHWPIKASWDRAAERLHGITLDQLWEEGRPALAVAQRMNDALAGQELFSDAPQDKTWLRLLFDAAGIEPAFVVVDTDARVLIQQAASDRGLDDAAISRARETAANVAPRRHRAESDARHLAVFWATLARGLRHP